ncbi:MAG: ATP-binding cassette domain-containing protein, partial [Nitrospira sp.]
MTQDTAETLLNIVGLNAEFHTPAGTVLANKNLSLSLLRGQTMGIVGESGSGKSVLCRAILGLIPSPPGFITGGEIWF